MLLGLGSTSSVQAQIVSTAQQYGVDPNLALAVAKQESGYQQTGSNGQTLQSTLSNGQPGALGVFQLMPATAAGLNVDPNDQTGNITGGVKLLSQLLTQFNGNVPLALAAYNSGAGNVQKYGGVPPFPETQNYVSSIMANYQSMGGTASSGTTAPQGSDSTPSDSTSPSDDSSSPLQTAYDAVTGIDFSDPTTMAAVGVAGLTVLYLVFG